MSELLQEQFDQTVDRCEASLATMREIVMMKRWDRLTDEEHGFESSMKQLRGLVESGKGAPQELENYTHRLQQLSVKQRRVMRLITTDMKRVSEDIDGVDQGSKKLRQISELFSES